MLLRNYYNRLCIIWIWKGLLFFDTPCGVQALKFESFKIFWYTMYRQNGFTRLAQGCLNWWIIKPNIIISAAEKTKKTKGRNKGLCMTGFGLIIHQFWQPCTGHQYWWLWPQILGNYSSIYMPTYFWHSFYSVKLSVSYKKHFLKCQNYHEYEYSYKWPSQLRYSWQLNVLS